MRPRDPRKTACPRLAAPRREALAASFVIVLSLISIARAAPAISSIDIRGLQTGAATTITITGRDLLPDPRITLSVPIANQVLHDKATDARIEIDVTLDAKAATGLANLWVTNSKGASDPQLVIVDSLPQARFSDDVPAMPVALHGSATGSTIAKTSFAGKSGQMLSIEIEAQRLGSKLRPVLHLYNESRKQIAWSLPMPQLAGDTRLEAKLPADGKYTIELHDIEYAGPGPGHFRMRVGASRGIDLVYPPVVERGGATPLELIGGAGASVTSQVNPSSEEPYEAITAPDAAAFTGLRPWARVSAIKEIVETADGAPQPIDATTLATGVAASGRLAKAGEQDRFVIKVKPESKLRLEVTAATFNAPIDAMLTLQKEDGSKLAENDDADGNPDPRIDYTIPKEIQSLVAVVSDRLGRGGADCIYRIVITDPDVSLPADFTTIAQASQYNVPQRGVLVMPVFIDRTNYVGPVRVALDGLPTGITAAAGDIPQNATGTLMALTGGEATPSQLLTRIRGVATTDHGTLTRLAAVEGHAATDLAPWLAREAIVALTDAEDPALTGDYNNLAADARIVIGGKLTVPVRTSRPFGDYGPVRATLITSHRVPRNNNGQADNNRALRGEKQIEVAVDKAVTDTFAALTAADKAVADARKAEEPVRAAAAKANADEAVAMKQAMDKFAAADKASSDAAANAKKATDALDTAAKALAELEAKSKAASDAQAADAAALAAQAKTAGDAKVAAEKAATDATAQAKATADTRAAAEKALADAQAKAKSVADAQAKAIADAEAKTKDASEKRAAADQAARTAAMNAKSEGELTLIVPPDLPESQYDLCVKLELLTPNKGAVVATAYTPIRRLETLNPIGVTLATAPALEATLDAKDGATIAVTGKIERRGGLTGEIVVEVVGTPGGIAAPKVTLKPEESDFKLELKAPANIKPDDYKGLHLSATGKFDGNQTVRSAAIELTLKLLAPRPPRTPEAK